MHRCWKRSRERDQNAHVNLIPGFGNELIIAPLASEAQQQLDGEDTPEHLMIGGGRDRVTELKYGVR